MDIVEEELLQLANEEQWSNSKLDAAQDYLHARFSDPAATLPEGLDRGTAEAIDVLVNRFTLSC